MSKKQSLSSQLISGILASVLIASSPATAATKNDKLEPLQDGIAAWASWVEHQSIIKGITSVSIGVVQDDQLIYSKSFGYANPDKRLVASPDTLYSVCSISKLFTAVSIMKLRDEGKLRLDDPVSKYVPEGKLSSKFPDAPIPTIRSLLTHSSGLAREPTFSFWDLESNPFPMEAQIKKDMASSEMLYPPHNFYEYSNLGYAMLGMIIKETSGESFQDYVQQQIFDPLGMENSYADAPWSLHGNQLAVGYTTKLRDGMRKPFKPFKTNDYASVAGVFTNVKDMAKFLGWQLRLRQAQVDGKKLKQILSPHTLAEMQQVHFADASLKRSRGLGFSVYKVGAKTVYGHSGLCPGYVTNVSIEPSSGLGLIVFTNQVDAPVYNIQKQGYQFIWGAMKAKADPSEAGAIKDLEFKKYTGVYESGLGQSYYGPWKGKLIGFDLSRSSPSDSFELFRPIGDHKFQRIRDDSKIPGEVAVFRNFDRSGKALETVTYNYLMKRVD
ncbi:serine hydrolase domain-containing protein [Pseudobacteriovorax antillogorgiicola]|uniref:CubicO group peptidase, beta-lactamase class C family n=1 Tax=Pseudobacteriovorax antillogorgiicola TaxID=1513793 RepID=A0A1Y6CKZ9_9BACT|nr:serine hydrolase domain-containing protein [Pseudobacteriovorax antillogorgiicola]TCS45667.1 CubicO group peptidase (beta-lactamase class C family) [Pseudobacteriovorax antillogorgiicola]SMF73056.1 CubicO group peptidase, beta-lactamase class C family [Pseudobacteriovorax antillogorgiicola]